jgi:two-component system response regulator BaeR
MSGNILIIEDETDLAAILVDYLTRDGYTATVINDGVAAAQALQSAAPELVLLDVMLPGVDGLTLLRELRKYSALPVILMTARVEEIDRLVGLELGADDYICKPYSPREVVARVKAVLRRTRPGQTESTGNGNGNGNGTNIELDAEAWQARIGGRRLDLTPKEFQLLQALVARPGRVLSRTQLLDLLYSDNLDISERAVDSHMKNLRRKLAEALPGTEPIRSIYGVGFVFEA